MKTIERSHKVRAIIVKQPGGREQLKIVDVEQPSPGPREVLVKVKAAAINRTDIIQRESESNYANLDILGVEVAGIVEEAGEQALIKPGTPVMGLVNGGGYAEYAIMPADRAIPIPKNLTFEEAAAIPEVFLTAYQTLFWHGELSKDETVLIHAGGSGVGTAAIQLAKQFADANIITTAGSEEKLAFAKTLGAKVGINYKKEDFAKKVLQTTNEKGVDVILDFVGASYFEKNLKSIAVDGRWVLIGILGGTEVKEVNLWDFMLKRIKFIGTLLTPRSDEYKKRLTEEFTEKALPLFEKGLLKPIVDKTYAFEDVQEAHKRMEDNKNLGKILLKVDS